MTEIHGIVFGAAGHALAKKRGWEPTYFYNKETFEPAPEENNSGTNIREQRAERTSG